MRPDRAAHLRRRRVLRRWRAALGGLLLIVVVGVAVWLVEAGGGGKRSIHTPGPDVDPISAVESGLLPWRLPSPVSGEVVLPGRGRHLVVLGGLTGSSSASGVFSLDTGNGALR